MQLPELIISSVSPSEGPSGVLRCPLGGQQGSLGYLLSLTTSDLWQVRLWMYGWG